MDGVDMVLCLWIKESWFMAGIIFIDSIFIFLAVGLGQFGDCGIMFLMSLMFC